MASVDRTGSAGSRAVGASVGCSAGVRASTPSNTQSPAARLEGGELVGQSRQVDPGPHRPALVLHPGLVAVAQLDRRPSLTSSTAKPSMAACRASGWITVGPHPAEAVAARSTLAAGGQGDHAQVELGYLLDGDPTRIASAPGRPRAGRPRRPTAPGTVGIVQPPGHLGEDLEVEPGAALLVGAGEGRPGRGGSGRGRRRRRWPSRRGPRGVTRSRRSRRPGPPRPPGRPGPGRRPGSTRA